MVLQAYDNMWSILDDGSGSITQVQLNWLLRNVPQPLGVGPDTPIDLAIQYVKALNLQVRTTLNFLKIPEYLMIYLCQDLKQTQCFVRRRNVRQPLGIGPENPNDLAIQYVKAMHCACRHRQMGACRITEPFTTSCVQRSQNIHKQRIRHADRSITGLHS